MLLLLLFPLEAVGLAVTPLKHQWQEPSKQLSNKEGLQQEGWEQDKRGDNKKGWQQILELWQQGKV